MDIRKIIIYKMEKLNITRYTISKILNASPSNVYKFLDGGRRSVGAEKMVSIANVIGLSSALALFEIEHVKVLIHFLNLDDKVNSFKKTCFYLNLRYEFEYFDYEEKEQLDSLSDTLVDIIPNFDVLPTSTVLQFLSDYFLHKNDIGNKIINILMSNRFNDITSAKTSFKTYKPFHTNLDFDLDSIIIEAQKFEHKQHTNASKSNRLFGVNIKEPEKAAQQLEIYQWRFDIYYRYINDEITLKIAEDKLSQLDEIESILYKPKINEIDYIFYQMFNNEIISYPPRYKEFNDQYNRLVKINLYESILHEGVDVSIKYCFKQYQIPNTNTNNVIIGVRINNDNSNQLIASNYAVVELDATIENDDHVLVSINKQTAVVGMLRKVNDKYFIKNTSSFEAYFESRTYTTEELKIFGKVIDVIAIKK